MNLSEKFNTFLEVAKWLNQHGIIPIIYGSLGLYRHIEQIDEIEDIDIVVPTSWLQDKFPELINMMQAIGYTQDTTFPHEFTQEATRVGFEPDADLSDCGVKVTDLSISKVDGVEFKELRAEDYLFVYRRTLEERQAKVKRDEAKVRAL